MKYFINKIEKILLRSINIIFIYKKDFISLNNCLGLFILGKRKRNSYEISCSQTVRQKATKMSDSSENYEDLQSELPLESIYSEILSKFSTLELSLIIFYHKFSSNSCDSASAQSPEEQNGKCEALL